MSCITWRALVALVATGIMSGAAIAQPKSSGGVTGFDKLHQQARIGGKVCMTDHEHACESQPSLKKGAVAAAICHWENFPVWEYGKPWGKHALAAGQKMDCKAGGAGWVCATRARPCRSAGS